MNTLRSERHTLRTIGVAAAAFTLAACTTSGSGGAHGSTDVKGDVVIGVAWPWAAHPEIRLAQGLEMAVDEVNRSGGVAGHKLRLRKEDDRESVDSGRIVAERLSTDPSVVAVIGHLQSYVTIPAAAIYDANGVILLSPTATDPELTAHGYKRVFRTTFTNHAVGAHMAEYAASHGYKRVAIYYVRDDYGRGLSNAFEERATDVGVAVVARQSYDPEGSSTETAFDDTFRRWSHLNADAIFVAGEVPLAGTLIADARKAGLNNPILGVDAMGSPALMSVGGHAVEGAVVPTVFHPDEARGEVTQFVASFTKRYGVAPDAGSALGDDAVWTLARAIRAANSTRPDSIARTLHAEHDSKGVTGALTFDASGNLVDRPLVKMVVRNGRFAYLPDGDHTPATVASR
jgi:branched-chain amino acid transport system substrate-binding protein